MLTHLTLKDFVIVRELSLDLNTGLTVLTGETGAGKSILIDAIQLILGARGDAGVVREGAKQADLTAIFDISQAAFEKLCEAGLADEAEDLLEKTAIIRRVIDKTGRSRSWINGVAVTLAQVKEVASDLLDIHGQNAQQSLLKPAGQLALLDGYGFCASELTQVKDTYCKWQVAQKELLEAKENAKKLADEADRLTWVNEELSQINPQKGEWEELNAEHNRLGNAHDILQALDSASEELSDNDQSALSLIGRNAEKLQNLAQYDEKLGEIADQLAEAQAIVEDAVRELERYGDRTDLDENRFEEVDQRVSLYFNAARKFHTLPEALFEKFEETSAQLALLQKGLDLQALEDKEKTALNEYMLAAKALSAKRLRAAEELSRAVTDSMQMLSMGGGKFEVQLTPCDPSASGLERCEFLVAGHSGVAPRALSKVASGGELSRIMLAIKTVLSGKDKVATLIFDEVDTGISGAAANKVGQKLKQVSQNRQVLCITHLAQIAALADHHLRITKHVKDGRTFTQVDPLDLEGRKQELARIIGGEQVTQLQLDMAEEMIKKA